MIRGRHPRPIYPMDTHCPLCNDPYLLVEEGEESVCRNGCYSGRPA